MDHSRVIGQAGLVLGADPSELPGDFLIRRPAVELLPATGVLIVFAPDDCGQRHAGLRVENPGEHHLDRHHDARSTAADPQADRQFVERTGRGDRRFQRAPCAVADCRKPQGLAAPRTGARTLARMLQNSAVARRESDLPTGLQTVHGIVQNFGLRGAEHGDHGADRERRTDHRSARPSHGCVEPILRHEHHHRNNRYNPHILHGPPWFLAKSENSGGKFSRF